MKTTKSSTNPEELQQALEEAASTSIVAATMMKLPADQLTKLREDFIGKPGGLTMFQFVSIMLKYSERQATLHREAARRLTRLNNDPVASSRAMQEKSLADDAQIINTVGDLVELFHQIDVNGDDSME